MMKQWIAILCLLGFSSAHALVEARMTYGLLASKPDLATIYNGTTSVPTVAPNAGIGFDALFIIPVVGIGGGIRYENMGFNAGSNGLDYKSQVTRTSLIVNYRLINTIMYLGPIATVGMSHSNSIKWTEGATSTNFSPDSTSSYSVGLEAGVGLLGFLIGAEAGYQNMKWSRVKDSSGTFAGTPDLDMSGTYMKVILGFGI
ncbi:MAG: hypothetical protein JNL11_00770 [Bdellovibrionaceae bacterium]|nr:hypothetical protein [Pseudobdellovibrionaceae bacterium]